MIRFLINFMLQTIFVLTGRDQRVRVSLPLLILAYAGGYYFATGVMLSAILLYAFVTTENA
ncbi:hypothetical protein CO725_24385 [Vibrio parahaemolyticus]|nr:hypothetical protein CO725_24385 [Vibrio parahaemolyticus]